MSETVTDYLGDEVDLDDCVLITHGQHEGEYILESDAFEHDDVVCPEEDKHEVLIEAGYEVTVDGDIIDSDDAVYIDSCSWGYEGMYHVDDTCYVEEFGEHRLRDDCTWSDNLSEWVYTSDTEYCYVDSHDDYFNLDDVHYSESRGEYVLRGSCEGSTDSINEYHCSPEANNYSKSWGIGFEVEKDNVDGETCEGADIQEQPLFAGWETDGSCGVEGITHVYDLKEGFQRFCQDVEDSDYCDADINSRCGGHVNVSGPADKFTLDNIRKYAGLIYALYKGRLNNSYACYDKKLQDDSYESKYRAIKFKGIVTLGNGKVGRLFEFRLVSKVHCKKQLKWRFRLFEMLSRAIEGNWSFGSFLKGCEPLLDEVYSWEKKQGILQQARGFNKYLNYDVTEREIERYVA